MAAGERGVVGRVPVLRGERMLEALQQPVDRGNDGIAVRYGQFAARHEGRLNIDQAEYVGAGIDLHRRFSPVQQRPGQFTFLRLARANKDPQEQSLMLRLPLPALTVVAALTA